MSRELPSKFFSWPALLHWGRALYQLLQGGRLVTCFTFRKKQLDLEFEHEESTLRLIWWVTSTGAALKLMPQATLPKKRVRIFPTLPEESYLVEVYLAATDRRLKLEFSPAFSLEFGFYPATRNVWLHQGGITMTFLKAPSEAPPATWLPVELAYEQLLKGELQPPEQSGTMPFELSELAETLGLELESSEPAAFPGAVQRWLKEQRTTKVREVTREKAARTLLKRLKRKLAKLEKELAECRQSVELEQEALALQNALAAGLVSREGRLEVPAQLSPTGTDWTLTDTNGPLTWEGLASRFKRVRKLKNRREPLRGEIDHTRETINKLENILSIEDVLERERQLAQFELPLQGPAKTGSESSSHKFRTYRSPSGFPILVGRSAKENDLLTFKVAHKEDWWFHARQLKGSHVILRTGKQTPTKSDLATAAWYAARYSDGKHSQIVPVQYCRRKHLRKPKGGAPGEVLLSQEEVLYIDLETGRPV